MSGSLVRIAPRPWKTPAIKTENPRGAPARFELDPSQARPRAGSVAAARRTRTFDSDLSGPRWGSLAGVLEGRGAPAVAALSERASGA